MYKHITKSRPNHRFASYKNKATIEINNLDSKKYCCLLETNPQVLSYKTSGNKILLLNNNCRYDSYTPDFTVQLRNNTSQVVFIDRKEQLTDYISRKLTSAYRRNDQTFIRVLPSQINLYPVLTNAEFLYRYAFDRIDFDYKIATYDFFQKQSAATLEDFQIHLQSEGLERSKVFKLIFDRRIEIDINKKLDETSIVRLGENQDLSI